MGVDRYQSYISDQEEDSGSKAGPDSKADAGAVVTLLAEDIPGAELAEPLEKHPVAALRWWLLCRGIKVPTSVRKKDLIDRLVVDASFISKL